jgi:phage-related protein
LFEIEFYSKNNHSPLFEFLSSIPKKDAAKIYKEIDMLQEFGLSLGMPYIKKLTDANGLWELRIKQSTNNYRVFYFTVKNSKIIMLNGFLKKTQKTPKKELDKALNYMNDYLERTDNHEI